MKMRFLNLFFLLILFSWDLFTNGSLPLQTYQSQVLLQLRKHLEYPLFLKSWEYYGGDLCYVPSTPQMTIKCQNNVVTELRLMGDFNKHAKVSDFHGFSIPNYTLSDKFSMDSFATTLARLTDLKVLSLVSLGIWGPVSDKIHRLNSLEILDLSSNYFYGSVPPSISRLVKLQCLRLDSNFFNDTVPDWLNSLSNLTVLSLTSNRFKGQVPSSVSKITTLVDLKLSHNELNGKLPDLSTLISLHVLDLGENHFDSELQDLPTSLVTCLLSKNSFSGKIPDQYGKLDHLQHLDLSLNALIGTPPFILFSLPKISYLDLSSNKLSGSLSKHLNCGGELGFVDISDNQFIGELPSCLGEISNERTVKYNGNCLSVITKDQHQEQYCKKSHVVKQSGGKDRWKLLGVIGGAVVFVILFAIGVYVFCRRYRSQMKIEKNIFPKVVQDNAPSGVSAELLANARIISQSVKYGVQGASSYRIFFFEELNEATNNFDQLAFMGEGSYGKMYKGNIENGTCVAIRSLTFPKRHAIQNLKYQLDLLSKLHHPHLVTLLGHCIDGDAPDDSYAKRVFLVYEYVPSWNYHTHLSENRPEKVLQWPDRLAILIGVAKAVHFLHTGVIPGYFNNRLKTNSILLDEHHVAKLSDYAMSIFTEDHEKRELKGEGPKSRRMADPEDDVYNFGFILLESLVGPIVTGKGETFLLNEMASFGSQDGRKRIVDPIVLSSCCQESLSLVVSITNKCISPERSTRPSFEDVLWNLQYAAQVQATADTDKKSDSASQS